mgnify:FL=1
MYQQMRSLNLSIAVSVAITFGGCSSEQNALLPPPEATPNQVQREIAFISNNFLASECFAELSKSKSIDQLPEIPASNQYVVNISAPELMNDAFEYKIIVVKNDRTGYLVRIGGIAGVHEIYGPHSLVGCLQNAFHPEMN